MAATTTQLIALANDSAFRARVNALAIQVASTIYAEGGNTSRVQYARTVLNGGASNIPNIIVFRTNIVASNVTYNFSNGHIETDAVDGAISSQISTDWNMLAGA